MIESLLEELHEGICRIHTGGRSLAHRVLLKAIGGQICRGKLKNTSRSVTSASGSLWAYTNQGEFLIRYPVRGHLLNGVWTL